VGGYDKGKRPGPAAWLDGNFKLHRTASKTGEEDVRYLLYDLSTDVVEKRDLSKAQPERLEAMKKKLLAWQQSVIRSLNGDDYETK
jgi:hypothetical protein